MDTNNNPDETPPKMPPTPVAIAAAFLAAHSTDGDRPDWDDSDPVRVFEMYLDPSTFEVVSIVELAAGHDAKGTLDLASTAPLYGESVPAAIVITAPGVLSTNEASLAALDDGDRLRAQVEHANQDTHTPHKGCRALAVTPSGFGGAIVAQRDNGQPSQPAYGIEDADRDNPFHLAAAALLASRRVNAIGRTNGLVASINDALRDAGLDLDNLDQDDLDGLNEDTRARLREAVRTSVTAAGLTDLLDELNPRNNPTSTLPEDYREQAKRLLDDLDD